MHLHNVSRFLRETNYAEVLAMTTGEGPPMEKMYCERLSWL